MRETSRHIIVLAGPNGAGKSTIAPALLQSALHVTEFVNADTLAQGLSAFDPEKAAFQAGRVMLKRLEELATANENFAFETTLASRTFAPWIKELLKRNYLFHLFFLWLPNPEACKKRVADRVSMGGHAVPNSVIERRYHAGLYNFFNLYQPIASSWDFFDNSGSKSPLLIASSNRTNKLEINNPELWSKIRGKYATQKAS